MTEQTPAIGLSLQINLSNSAQLVAQTHVAADCTAAQLNAAIDKIMDAAERQQSKFEIKAARMKMEKAREDLTRFLADLEHYEAQCAAEYAQTERSLRGNGDGEAMWHGQWKINRDNKLINIQDRRTYIEILTKEIAEHEARIAG